MKFSFKNILFGLIVSSLFVNCTDNDDNLLQDSNTEVQNFIWKGLNNYYLWQQNVPDLDDMRFGNPFFLNDFLKTKGAPEQVFQSLLYKPVSLFGASNQAIDKYSIIVDDYSILENSFQGIRTTSGISADYKYVSGNSGPIFGFVRYVLPNSDAANKNVKRGDLFYAINGTTLTLANRNSLLAADNYTMNFASFVNGTLTPNGVSLALTKSQMIENPIHIVKSITVGSKKIGYLMYNAFTANFDLDLNNAIGQLSAGNITDLVLDLRYNGGGSIQTATYLASMITGQFNGQVFAKEQWNPRLQTYLLANNPNALTNFFVNNIAGVGINHLNLSKVYILTTERTASASELVINGLKPYIDVIQIGTKTIGKNAGSVTLYDSPNFGKSGANRNHKYAMQPLVLKIVNKDNFGEYENGLLPQTSNTLSENVDNLGILGDANEPMLKKALDLIGFRNRGLRQNPTRVFENIENDLQDFTNEMYIDRLPIGLEQFFK